MVQLFIKNNLAAIVALDNNLGIGFQDSILITNPVDMFIFKTYSLGISNCLVGRVTYDTLPFVVKKSRNLIKISRQTFKDLKLKDSENYLVIGGNQIYKLFSENIKIWVITYHKISSKKVDAYFDKNLHESIIQNFKSFCLYEDKDMKTVVYF